MRPTALVTNRPSLACARGGVSAIAGTSFEGTRELGAPDYPHLDASGMLLTFSFENIGSTDDVRIITSSGPEVPVLGSLGLLIMALALGVTGCASRRSRA